MPKIIVKVGKTQDGEYDLDINRFTWRERAFITELSGTLPPEFLKKWFEVDPMTVIATTAVMMQRAGLVPDIDSLMDAETSDAITVDYSDLLPEGEEADAEGPPESPSPSGDGEGDGRSEGSDSGG
jgi:hypothetical protein